VDTASALKLAAVGWTAFVLALAWALLERRQRRRSDDARWERDRESDAERVERMAKQREAVAALRNALDAIEATTQDEDERQ
jgi:hypothetical protein